MFNGFCFRLRPFCWGCESKLFDNHYQPFKYHEVGAVTGGHRFHTHYSIDTTQEIYLDRQVGLSRMEETGSELNDGNEMAARSPRRDDFEDHQQDAVDEKSQLLRAIYDKNIHLIQLLLRNGFDVNAALSDGKTAFYFACKGNRTNIISIFIDNGAAVHREIAALWLLKRRHKPSWFLFKRLLYMAAKNNWFNIVDLLITEFSVDVNSVFGQKTALIGAVEGGHFEMVKKLSSSGAALESLRRTCRRESLTMGGAQIIVTYEKLNKTALHVACVNENYDIVEFLADKGGASYVDVVDRFRRTALFYAALAEKSGHHETPC